MITVLLLVAQLPMTALGASSARQFWGVSPSSSKLLCRASIPSHIQRGWTSAATSALLPRGGANGDAAEDDDEKKDEEKEKEQQSKADISVEGTKIQGGWGEAQEAKIKEVIDRIADQAENDSMVDGEEEEEEEAVGGEAASIEVQPFMEEAAASAEAEDLEDSQSSFATAVMDDPSIDDDSSAFVDRMELADAYDEGETTPGSFEEENASRTATAADGSVEDAAATGKDEGEEAAVASTETPSEKEVGPKIDDAMKDILIKELNYTRRDVNAMKYEIAAMVIEKRLFRPNEGMPANWYRDGHSPSALGFANVTELKDMLGRFAIPVAVTVLVGFGAATMGGGWVAVLTGVFAPKEDDDSTEVAPVQASPLETLPEQQEADLGEVAAEAGGDANADEKVEEDKVAKPEVKPVNEHTDALGEPHPHSVKPGQIPQDELDVTWLDKAITAVENKIKAFLRMEL